MALDVQGAVERCGLFVIRGRQSPNIQTFSFYGISIKKSTNEKQKRL